MSIDRSKSDEIHENSVKTQQHCQKGRCEEHRSKTSSRSISKLATCFQVVPVKPSAATNSAKRKKMDRVEGKSRKHAASIGAERRAPHIKNGAAAEENCEDGRLGRRRMHKWAAGLKYLRFLLNFLFFSSTPPAPKSLEFRYSAMKGRGGPRTIKGWGMCLFFLLLDIYEVDCFAVLKWFFSRSSSPINRISAIVVHQ